MRRYKWLVFLSPILAAISAVLIVTWMQPVWEASAQIQVGQVGPVVEPPSRTVARLQSPSFIYKVFDQPGVPPDEEAHEFSLYKASFKARQLPGTDLIELKVRAASIDGAKKLILATVKQVRSVHDEMMRPSVDRMEREFAEVEKGAREGQNMVNDLRNRLISGNTGAAGTVIYVMLIQQKMAEIRGLMERKLSLEEQMHPARTFPTKLVGEVYVDKRPVSPKKGLIVSLVTLLAFFGAVLTAFMLNSMTAGRQNNGVS